MAERMRAADWIFGMALVGGGAAQTRTQADTVLALQVVDLPTGETIAYGMRGQAVIDFRPIAADAVAELRRQMCRRPHDMTPAEMMKCPRCSCVLRLEAAERRVADDAIIQRVPTDAEHATNVQLSALINRIEQDGWARLDGDDVRWLKEAVRP